MSLWICTGCTAAYSVGAPKCPQCGSTEHVEEGAEDMAKITVHGGASNAAAEDNTGEEAQPSPDGGTSSTSSETEPSSPETSKSETPSPVPTTGSRSRKGRTDSSTATGTAGGQTAPTSDVGKD